MADKNDEQLYVGGGTKVFPKLGGNAVTTDKIADGAVTEAKLAAGAVTNGALSANAVTADKLNSGAVTNAKLAPGAVTGDKVANNALVSSNFMDLAVTTAKLNDGSVTSAKLGDGAVTLGKIGANAVTTSSLQNRAVTEAKLANFSVSAIKLQDHSVMADHLANNAVTEESIADYAIHFRHLGLPCFVSRTEETLQNAANHLCNAYFREGNPLQDNYLFRLTMLPDTDGINLSYTRTDLSDGTVSSDTKYLLFGWLFFTSDFSNVRIIGLTADQGLLFNNVKSPSYTYVYTIHNFMACPLIAHGNPTRVVDISSSNDAKVAAFSAEDEDDYDAGLANE